MFEDHIEIGYNYRMTDIQAAVGIKQLEKLDWIIGERRKIARTYGEAFKDVSSIQLPLEKEGYFSNYQSYSIFLKPGCPIERNTLMQKLMERGIATRRGIMTAHRETAYRKWGSKLHLPVSEALQDRSILLPLYVPMSNGEVQYVIDSFLEMVNEPCRDSSDHGVLARPGNATF
jgi:dTDP-4-amino-4,6-dideoxygalactose transaminase